MSMPLRALLYRRPSEPQTITVASTARSISCALRRHRAGAPLHAAHPCRHARSRAHHAAARQRQGGARLRAEARRLDRGAARPAAAAGAVRARHACCRCAASTPHRASAAARAARSGSRSAPTASALLCVAGDARACRAPGRAIFSSARPSAISKRRAGRAAGDARRQHQARVGARPVEPLGLLLDHRRAVLFLAADPGAAFRARLSRRARGRASGRDEPLAQVLAAGRAASARVWRAPKPGSTPMAPTCIATGGSRYERAALRKRGPGDTVVHEPGFPLARE